MFQTMKDHSYEIEGVNESLVFSAKSTNAPVKYAASKELNEVRSDGLLDISYEVAVDSHKKYVGDV